MSVATACTATARRHPTPDHFTCPRCGRPMLIDPSQPAAGQLCPRCREAGPASTLPRELVEAAYVLADALDLEDLARGDDISLSAPGRRSRDDRHRRRRLARAVANRARAEAAFEVELARCRSTAVIVAGWMYYSPDVADEGRVCRRLEPDYLGALVPAI